jgi:putative flippase GtrA
MMNKKHLRREVVGFSLVGSISFIVDFVAFNGSVILGLDLWIANLVAISCSAIFGFLGNSFYSFRHRFEKGSRNSIATRYIFFTLVSVFVSMGLTSIVLEQLSDQGLLIVNLGRVTAILGVVVLRFLGLKFIVYKSKAVQEVPSA